MNLLEQAEYDYVRDQLKKVLKDMQATVEYFSKKGNANTASRIEENMKQINNFACFCEHHLKFDNTTPHDDAVFYDKEGHRLQTILQLERDMPHLFQKHTPNTKTYVSQ